MSAPHRRATADRSLLLALVLAAALLLALPAAAAALPTAPQAAASRAESYVIKSDGTLWVWGGNAFGGLGLGDFLPRSTPVQLGIDTDWKSIVVSPNLGVIALKQGGTLWQWGDASLTHATPTMYSGGSWDGVWTDIAAGGGHALALKNGGELWAWGDDNCGQLGVANGSATPTRVGSDTWQSVACGDRHSLGVTTAGELYAWGDNSVSQLGLGDTTERDTPQQVGVRTDWKAVFAGEGDSSFALTDSGDLYAWGYNGFCGCLGIGSSAPICTTPTRVAGGGWAHVATGPDASLAIKADGSLWSMGANEGGVLGLTTYGWYKTPVRVGTATTWAAVATGGCHTVAVTSADQFAACGYNQYGQLGLGYPLYRCSPEQIGTADGWTQVSAGWSHAGAIRADGTLWMWGRPFDGALGGLYSPVGGGDITAPTQLGADTDWKTVSCGGSRSDALPSDSYTAAIKTDGTLWTWGGNDAGQLGLGDREQHGPTQVGTGTDWKAVATSNGCGDAGRTTPGTWDDIADHTLALKNDGTLWAWGANNFGQLGFGDSGTDSRCLAPHQVGTDADWAAIAAGVDYSAALKADGTLWVWGNGQSGQLGQGDSTFRTTPTQVLTSSGPNTFTAFACAAGYSSHMLAVKTDGTLWGWGSNFCGELGLGRNNIGPFSTPQQIGAGTDWKSVACGFGANGPGNSYANFNVALTKGNELWSFGANGVGQLGHGDYVMLYVPTKPTGSATWQSVTAGGGDSFGIKPDGTLWAWGDSSLDTLGLGDPAAYPSTSVFPLESFTDSVPPVVDGAVVASKAVTHAATTASGECSSARCINGWTNTPRKITVSASDANSGLSRTQISLTGGVGYVTRSSLTVRNGDVTVRCRAIDRMGNTSVPQSLGHFKIDTTRPSLSSSAATVKSGGTAVLRYRITDYSPCTVRIVIKNAAGKVVKTFLIGGVRPNAALTKSFRCGWRKGTYRWYASATDSVGYKQVKVAVNKLYVK